MGRPITYGRRMRVYVSPEHLELIERDRVLNGGTTSAALRRALDHYFQVSTKKRREKAS